VWAVARVSLAGLIVVDPTLIRRDVSVDMIIVSDGYGIMKRKKWLWMQRASREKRFLLSSWFKQRVLYVCCCTRE